MKQARTVLNVAIAAGLIALSALGGSAHAGQIPGTIILNPVQVNGQLAISALAYSQTLTAPGTKFLTPPIFVPGGNGIATPACTAAGFCDFGMGEISATVGIDPTIILSAAPANNGGGESFLDMSYQVVYAGNDPAGTVVNAGLLVGDMIDQTGLSAAEAVISITGDNGTIYLGYHCEAAPGAAFGCRTNIPNTSFANQSLSMIENSVYDVDMQLTIYAHDAVSATIDPIFVAPLNGHGEFVFSPGIGGGVPEPAAWALMFAGFGLAGAALRRRRTVTTA